MIRKEPDLELEGLLKRSGTMVKFFQGTMMNAVDLGRVKVRLKSPHNATTTKNTTFFLFLFFA